MGSEIFRPKLKEMVQRAQTKGDGRTARHVREFAGTLATVLKEQRWGEPRISDVARLAEAADNARAVARTLDASHCVTERVLAAENGRVIDIPMPPGKDLRDVQARIFECFESKQAPERGFVYVAWRQRPERYIYVGKAGNTDRMNLAAHGKLARATAEATLLSLAFPAQSREEYLLEVEASIIELVTHFTGDKPELNDRPARVPTWHAQAGLDSLADYLAKESDRLRAV
jgi:hypothetical protein